jgi:chromosome segregation ATPase
MTQVIKQVQFKLDTDTKGVDSGIKDVNTQFADLNKRVEEGNYSMREASKIIQQYQDIALKAGRESPIGREALEAAAVMKDRVTDLRNEVGRLAQDGRNVQTALQLGSTVLAGYSAFTGVTAMLGVENEELLKTLTKMQAAQSALMGIETIRKSLEKESLLMIQARTLWTKASTAATGLYTTATTAATAATRALNLAIGAGIIGGIIAGVAALAANWDKVTKALGLAKTQGEITTAAYLKDSGSRIAEIKREIKEREEILNISIRQAQIDGKDATDLLKTKSQVASETYKTEQTAIKEAIAEREKALIGLHHESTAYKQIQAEIGRLNDSYRSLGDELNQLELERRANINKAVQAIDEQKKKEQDILNKAAEAQKAAREKAEQERLAAEKKEFENAEALMYATRDLAIANIEDTAVRRAAQLQVQQSKEREDLIAKFGADTELLKELETKQFNEVEALKAELQLESEIKAEEKRVADLAKADEQFALHLAKIGENIYTEHQLELEQLDSLLEQKLISEEDYANRKLAIDEKLKTAEQQILNAKVKAQQMAANAVMSIMSSASQMAKEGTIEAKMLAGAQIAISTAVGIAGAVQSIKTASSPWEAIAGIAAGIAAVVAGIAGATSALSKANIPGGGGGGVPSISAPNIVQLSRPSGGDSENRVINTGAQNNNTNQVVVLASDITDTQNSIQNIENTATVE